MASTEPPAVTHAQDDDDDRGSQPRSDCLGTPVVLRIIMEHLSSEDLLEISLVNKLWNYEARSVLKNRGDLVATLKSKSPCQEVGAFASDLRRMNVVPFSGISIELAGSYNCEDCEEASPTGALDPNYSVILDRVPWDCLRFHWGQKWETDQKCQAFQLAHKILQDFSEDLEELKVHIGSRSKRFMEQILQPLKFPQLKYLDLATNMREPDEDCTSLTKALLSRAPNLQEFRESRWVNLEENVMEGSGAVLVTHSPVQPAYDGLPEGILATLCLVNLDLEVTEEDCSVERFNRIIPLLLENSETTLESVCIDAVFALPLMCYGVQLESVRDMMLFMDYDHLELTHPRVLTFLKAFDFTRMFPNLCRVNIETFINHMASEPINELILQGNPLLPNVPAPDRAANITELSLSHRVEYSVITFLAQMFPNTKYLSVNGKQEREFPYELIWSSFKGLEELKMDKRGHYYENTWPKNFDSVFCGIFPEEVAELMEKDEEYLRSVNIVPVMPAITCLSGLRCMHLDIWSENFGNEGILDLLLALVAPPTPKTEYGRTFLFSKVTGLIAFARMPGLSVSITIHGNIAEMEQATIHLKRYATVSIKKLN